MNPEETLKKRKKKKKDKAEQELGETTWSNRPNPFEPTPAYASPALSNLISRLDPLNPKGKQGRVTYLRSEEQILPDTEINNSDSLTFEDNRKNRREQEKSSSSATSGLNTGGSSELVDSEDSKNSTDSRKSSTRKILEEDNDESSNSKRKKRPEEDNDERPNSLSDNEENKDKGGDKDKTNSPISKIQYPIMATFEAKLEYLLTSIMAYKLTDPVPLALDKAFIKTFDDFRDIAPADVHLLEYSPTLGKDTPLHFTHVRAIHKALHYAKCLETNSHADFDDPQQWSPQTYRSWCRNDLSAYLLTLASATTASAPSLTVTTGSTQQQKDDDAALISWNRKPRDVAKYPILKTDADYQDWRLKMKRQLISDTLLRVTLPTFDLGLCRTGTDKELAKLQLNFFEQILAAVLHNAIGKGLVTLHPENSIFVWSEHEAHQTTSESAQITSTAMMTKLMSLKILDCSTRHEFLILFNDTTNRYDKIADVALTESLKRTLLQAALVHDSALSNAWITVNEVRRAANPTSPATTYSEYYNFLVNQSKTHDIATPLKRKQRHAHMGKIDSFTNDSNDVDDDEDSVLEEIIAQMSIQNEPMNEDVLNALQVYSTVQRRRNNNGQRKP